MTRDRRRPHVGTPEFVAAGHAAMRRQRAAEKGDALTFWTQRRNALRSRLTQAHNQGEAAPDYVVDAFQAVCAIVRDLEAER